MDRPAPVERVDANVDDAVRPEGFVVLVEPSDRIHFLDWGGPVPSDQPGVLLLHGLGQTALIWSPVARRLRPWRRTVAMDLRGHGLSDSPTEGYHEETLVGDLVAVADGSGLLGLGPVVLAGHGFGAVIAAWAAAALRDRCAGLVLVDGGWEDIRASTGQEPAEFVRTIEEPPEVLRSMRAFLADRAAFDPATWDADQEEAARSTVVETQAGRVVPSTRPHALAGMVDALFSYRPVEVLSRVTASITALVAGDDAAGTRGAELAAVREALRAAGGPEIAVARFPSVGHNLIRYRPADVTAAILDATSRRPPPGPAAGSSTHTIRG